LLLAVMSCQQQHRPGTAARQQRLLQPLQEGTWYGTFKAKAEGSSPAFPWAPGSATFRYPNSQPPTFLWYHDHT
jgi:hypothetical protein